MLAVRVPLTGAAARRTIRLERTFGWCIALSALGLGVAAALVYDHLGLTLSHPDARAHLVVARRVIDSLTPGWRQIGAVWLPLPHLLNLVPVQFDAMYRTGASAVVISIVAFAATAHAVARLVERITGSRWAAASGAAIVMLNPNVLYLQATPMTEPIYMALTTLGLAFTYEWVLRPEAGTSVRGVSHHRFDAGFHQAGLALAAGCLTRYEAWAVSATAAACTAFVCWRQGRSTLTSLRRAAMLGAYPLVAIGGFFVLSRLTTGQWFVSPLFMRTNPARGRLLEAASQVWIGLCTIEHGLVVLIALAGAILILVSAIRSYRQAPALLVLALLAAGIFPWHAYYDGHPFRARYMVQMLPALAVCAGLAVGKMRRAPRLAAIGLIGVAGVTTLPFDFQAPMLHEAQWDLRKSVERRSVTDHLQANHDGERILISMGALAHFMHETSRAGFRLRDFVHEGNGGIWTRALDSPAHHVGWIVIKADDVQRRDRLLAMAASRPDFLSGFVKVIESGGVALYRREPLP